MLPSRAWVWQARLTNRLTKLVQSRFAQARIHRTSGCVGPPTGDLREPPVRAKLQNNNPGQDNTKPAGAHYLQKL